MLASDTRRSNRSAVLRALLTGVARSRTEIADHSGLSKATVTRVVDELIAEGLVRQTTELPTGSRGRRAVELEVAAELGLTSGVDMGATNTRFLVTDLNGRPVGFRRRSTPAGIDAHELARWVAGNVFELCRQDGDPDNLWSTSIGVPGVVHPKTNAITCGDNLPAIEGLDFVRSLRAELPGAVVFDNDANLALVGELAFGAGRGHRSVVVFTIGTGIAAGVAVDGQLLRGRSGFVGEFGYLPVGGAEPLTLEQAVGGTFLVQRAQRRGLELDDARKVFASEASEETARLREEVERALVTGFAAVTAAYEPEAIILAGGVGESLFPWISRLQRQLTSVMAPAPSLLQAECGDAAGCLGALVRALEHAYGRLGLVEPDGQLPSWIGQGVDVASILNAPTAA